MGGGTTKAILGSNPITAPLLIVQNQYEKEKQGQKNELERQQKQQKEFQDAQLAALSKKDTRVTTSLSSDADQTARRRRLRGGILSTIKTSGSSLGVPALSTPALVAGTKKRLGQ